MGKHIGEEKISINNVKLGEFYPTHAVVEGDPLFIVKPEVIEKRKRPFMILGKVFFPDNCRLEDRTPYPLFAGDIGKAMTREKMEEFKAAAIQRAVDEKQREALNLFFSL